MSLKEKNRECSWRGWCVLLRPLVTGLAENGKFAKTAWDVIGFSNGPPHGNPDFTLPGFGEGLASVASPAFEEGVAMEGTAFEHFQIALVDISHAGSGYAAAVVEHERVFVRVAEEFELNDWVRRAILPFVDVVEHFGSGGIPFDTDTVFAGKIVDPSGVGFAIFALASRVATTWSEPHDGVWIDALFDEFAGADVGGRNEVRPPAVMLMSVLAQVFPFPQSRATHQ